MTAHPKLSAEWEAIDAFWESHALGRPATRKVFDPERPMMTAPQRRAVAMENIRARDLAKLENEIDVLRRAHYELLADIYGPNPKYVRV